MTILSNAKERSNNSDMDQTLLNFNHICDHIAIGIGLYDQRGVMLDCNQALLDIFDITDKEGWIGSKYNFFDDGNLSQYAIRDLEACTGKKLLIHYHTSPYRHSAATDNTKYHKIVEVTTSRLANEGTTTGYMLTYYDVTDSKQQQTIPHAIYENVAIGIELYDQTGQLAYINPYAIQALGIENIDHTAHINIFNSPNINEHTKDRIRAGEDFEYELEYDLDIANKYLFRTSQSGKRNFSMKFVALRNESDHIDGYMVAFSDVTLMRARQKLLEDTQINLSLALEAGKMSIWRYDIKNQTFIMIMGENSVNEQLTLDQVLPYVDESDHRLIISAIDDIAQGKADELSLTLRIRRSQGQDYRYIEIQFAVRCDNNGVRAHIIGIQHDITEQYLHHKYMNNARRSLNMALAASKIVAWDYDLNSKNLQILYGDDIQESTQTYISYHNSTHPKDHDKYATFIKEIASGKVDKNTIEIRIKNSNNEYTYHENTVASLRDENGQVSHLIGSTIDISERREREKAERDLKTALELMLETGKVSIWKYILSESRFYSMLDPMLLPDGTTYDECMQAIAPDSREEYQRVLSDLISGRKDKEHAVFHIIDPATGIEHYIQNELAVLYDDNGERSAIIGTQRYITQDIILKRELEEFRIKTKLINEKNNIIHWDYNINNQSIITYGNRSIGDGATIDHDTYLRYVHPNDRPLASRVLQQMSRRESTSEDYAIWAHLPGYDDYRYLIVNITPIYDQDGTIVSYTGIRRDATEEAQRNKELAEKSYKTELVIKASGVMPWEYDCTQGAFITENNTLIECEMSTDNYNSPYNSGCKAQLEQIWDIINGRRDESFSIDIRYKINQEWVYATIAGEPYEWDSDGKVIRYLGYRNNTTDLEIMYESIRESKFKTELAIKKANMTMWEYSVEDGMFTALNDPISNFDESKKYPPQEYLSCQDPSAIDEATAIRERMNRQELGEFSFKSKVMMPGSTEWQYLTVHGSHSEVSEEDPSKATKYIGFRVDNTEMVKLAQGIEESNILLSSILNQSPSAIFIKEIADQWRYIIANDMFCKICNIEEQDLLGRTDYDLFDLCVANKFHEDDTKAASFDGVYSFIEHFDNGQGKKALHTTKRMITLGDGRQLLVGVISDITETMAQQKELKRANKKIELVLNNANTGLIYIDNDFRVVWENMASISNNPHTQKYKRGEICYQSTRGLDAPCSDCVVLKARESMTKEKVTKTFDDGTILEIFANPILDIDNKISGYVCRIDNVTEDVLKAKKLEETQKFLDMAIDAGKVAVWGYNPKTDMVFNISGRVFERDTLPLCEAISHIHPEDQAIFDKIWMTLINGESEREEQCLRFLSPFTNEYEYIDKSMVTLRSPDGELAMIIGTHRDVTEDKRQKMALEDSNEKLNLALNIIQAFSWHIDTRNGKLLFDNNFAVLGLGPESTDSIDKFAMFIHPEDRPYFLEKFDELSRDDHTEFTLNYRVDFHNRGNYEWYETRGKVKTLYDNGIPYKYLYGMDCNITHHKQITDELTKAKKEFEEANSLLHNIIKQIPFGLYIKDVDNDLRYIIMNDVLANMDHVDSKDVIGKTDYELFDPYLANIFMSGNKIAVKKQDGELTESHHTVNCQGQEYTFESSNTTITVGNGRRLLIGIVADITKKEQMLRELKVAKHRAEQSDKLKSAFLANMSHEIRTPLNAIVGFSELLSDANDTDEKAEYTSIISFNNELLLRLIGDILDLSKIESGMIELKAEQFDLSEVINDVYTMLKPKVNNPNVEFIMENPYKQCIVELDKNRVRQVDINYITNAIKYTASGSIKMGYSYIDGGIEIYVEDTGIGIAPENYGKVFQRFEKFDSFAQGTGLGLSICKAIIDAQDGKIGFTSEVGKGSRFWAWFPCKAQIEMQETKSEQKPNTNHSTSNTKQMQNEEKMYKVLVAEDNSSNFLLIRHILKAYDITRANNGQEAVELAKAQKFDIILMDWKMPILDGMQATEQIRQFDQTTPIIAVTANAFESDKTIALERGCNAFVAKPLKSKELLGAITQLL